MSLAASAGYNLFARFTFKNNAGIRSMRQTRTEFEGLRKSAMHMKRGLGYMKTGFSQVAMFGGVAALAIGAVVKEGATFEKQMSVVKSIVNTSSKEGAKNIGQLEKEALRLGRTTSFTAVQAAQGMEQLSRAGFKWHETLNSIEPVLKLAEADSMELATASDIVASSIRSFRLEASQATMVTDVLAYTSANSNTNVTALGESMRYAASIAKTSKITFKETVAALGMLGDIGLKGSIAGTALKNALLKINKPSKKVMKIFGGREGWLNIMQKNGKTMTNFKDRFSAVMNKVSQFKTPAERAAALMEIFGLRGIATAGALESFGLKMKDAVKGDASKSFEGRLKALNENAKGTAKSMAEMRLDNLAGQWTLFKSAVSGAAIQIYKSFGDRFTDVVRSAIEWTSAFGAAIADVNQGAAEGSIVARYGQGIADIIFGIKEGVLEAIGTIQWLGSVIASVLTTLNGGVGRSRKEWIKLIAKFTTLAVTLGPVVVAFGAVAMAAGGAFRVVKGMFWFITGAVGGVLRSIGGLHRALHGMKGLGAASKVGGMLGKVGRGLGRIGALAATPVYVVNMPAWGVLGEVASGAASKGGILQTLMRGGASGQKGLMRLMFGGGYVGTSAGAAKLAAAGTTLTAGAMALAAVAPALTAIYQIGKVHTKEGKKEHRKKIMKMVTPLNAEGLDPVLGMFGLARDRHKDTRPAWQKKFHADTMIGMQHMSEIKEVSRIIGREGFSYSGFALGKERLEKNPILMKLLQSGGMAKLRQLSPEQLQQLRLNKGMIILLDLLMNRSQGESEDLIKMMEYMQKVHAKPTIINIDGKEIAIATVNAQNDSSTRGGKSPKAGRNSKAQTQGRG